LVSQGVGERYSVSVSWFLTCKILESIRVETSEIGSPYIGFRAVSAAETVFGI